MDDNDMLRHRRASGVEAGAQAGAYTKKEDVQTKDKKKKKACDDLIKFNCYDKFEEMRRLESSCVCVASADSAGPRRRGKM